MMLLLDTCEEYTIRYYYHRYVKRVPLLGDETSQHKLPDVGFSGSWVALDTQARPVGILASTTALIRSAPALITPCRPQITI